MKTAAKTLPRVLTIAKLAERAGVSVQKAQRAVRNHPELAATYSKPGKVSPRWSGSAATELAELVAADDARIAAGRARTVERLKDPAARARVDESRAKRAERLFLGLRPRK